MTFSPQARYIPFPFLLLYLGILELLLCFRTTKLRNRGKSPPSPAKDAPPLSTTHVPILQPDKDVVQHLAMPRAQSVIGALLARP